MCATSRRSEVRLQRRDLELFELLLERRVETLGHLHRLAFDGKAQKTARNRLIRLRQGGYIERVALSGIDEQLLAPGDSAHPVASVYRLTPKGIAALRLRHRAGAELRGRGRLSDLTDSSIPHQLAVGRVGDWLGTRLIGEHLLDCAGKHRRHRPDAAYHAHPDADGRTLVLVEVDLGNYTRQRILGKLRTFLANEESRGAIFVSPDTARAEQVAGWIRARHGDGVMRRVQVLTLDELRDGQLLDPDLSPAQTNPGDTDPSPTM